MSEIKLPKIGAPERVTAVRCAVERELALSGGLKPAEWSEIQDKSLADLVSENTDALTDDIYEGGLSDEDTTGILILIKAGSEMLGADYLTPCLTHLGGRWAR